MQNSGSGKWGILFYEHRIPGSSTTARVYERPAGVLVAANDPDGECIAGMRRRDRGQGHEHSIWTYVAGALELLTSAGSKQRSGNEVSESGAGAIGQPISDAVNGTPRTGKTTDPRAMVGHLFMHGVSYLA